MAATATVKAYVLIDENGDFVASHDMDMLKELYEDSIEEMSGCIGYRTVEVELTIPLPVAFKVAAIVPCVEQQPIVSVA